MTKYFFLGILLAVHSVSCYFLKGLKRNHIGIELITLITVLAGVAYGAKAGAAFGALSIAADYVFSGRISYFSLVTIPSYALIGVISSLLASTSLPVLGVLMAVIYNVATSIIIFCFLGGDLDKCIRFGVTAVAFNFLIFSSFAGALLSLMV
ncbi:hypothetical protein HYU11_00470 [Candidatus Woesearchaeota archaeon]|nr:hypothetical protein [Candidatus Woesearchaeota archaeon]